jgi:hypothetical protein
MPASDEHEAILSSGGRVVVEGEIPDPFRLRAEVRQRFGVRVEETPIRFVEAGALHLVVKSTGEMFLS